MFLLGINQDGHSWWQQGGWSGVDVDKSGGNALVLFVSDTVLNT